MPITKKRVRWTCDLCGKGALGPSRPRRNNAVRYCLPCTEATGKLTERHAPALEAKRQRKAEAKKTTASRRREAKPPRPRRTKRSWMKEDKYSLSFDGATANAMEISERMCKSTRWDAAVLAADGPARGCRPAGRLWERTMQSRAKPEGYGIRIYQSKNRDGGRGGPGYGVSVTFDGWASPGNVLMTLLHEITHVVHLSCMRAPMVNGKRRPHDLAFNVIQYRMARSFWGYDTEPYAAGWSVGKGYAPSRHLRHWLDQQFKAGNPRVLKWFQVEPGAPCQEEARQ